MFKLNDRTIQVHGYAQRTTNEWPALGIDRAAVDERSLSNRMMVEGNANLVRWMHVTPWKQDVESCDRVGLMESMPAGDSEKDVEGRRWQQRLELMRDAIIYNRNNPSIIFYESGNKGVTEAHMARDEGAARQIRSARRPRDPARREMLDSKTAEYGGEMLYINKSATQADVGDGVFAATRACENIGTTILRRFTRTATGRCIKTRTRPNTTAIRIRMRSRTSCAGSTIGRARPGTGRRVSSGGVNIIFSDSNTHHRGAENYRRSGEVDAMRIPKDGYFADQVMWDGWVDVEHPRTHIIGHWNYAPGTTKNVYVVSSAEKVELFINGRVARLWRSRATVFSSRSKTSLGSRVR